MKVTMVTIVVRAIGTIPKDLEKRHGELKIRGIIETVHTTTLLRSVRIFRQVLVNRRDLLFIGTLVKITTYHWCE